MNIMLDLETMGNEPGCAIVAIGAVKFDTEHGVYDRAFYRSVSLKSCTDKGLTIDPDTLVWWLKQSDEARMALLSQTCEIKKALIEFTVWAETDDNDAPPRSLDPWTTLWCCGTDFDIPILKKAFAVCNKHWPFQFSGYRDYRTYRSLWPVLAPMPERKGLHNALDDAKYQATVAIMLSQELGRPL